MKRRCPKTSYLGWDDYFSFKDLLVAIGSSISIQLLTKQLVFVEFVYSRPIESVVHVKSINFELIDYF